MRNKWGQIADSKTSDSKETWKLTYATSVLSAFSTLPPRCGSPSRRVFRLAAEVKKEQSCCRVFRLAAEVWKEQRRR